LVLGAGCLCGLILLLSFCEGFLHSDCLTLRYSFAFLTFLFYSSMGISSEDRLAELTRRRTVKKDPISFVMVRSGNKRRWEWCGRQGLQYPRFELVYRD
jgi:hypothetical protein